MRTLPRICTIVCLLLWTLSAVSKIYAASAVINEFVPAPAGGESEWVELYNASDSADYLRSYYLDDDTSFDSDTGSSAKKSLVSLDISNGKYPFFEIQSPMFNNDGDSVVLFDGNGSVIDEYTYSENPGSAVSVGRSPDGSGQFVLLASQTKGLANTDPLPAPTATPTDTPVPTHTPKPTPTPSPTAAPVRTPTPTKIPAPSPTITRNPTTISTTIPTRTLSSTPMITPAAPPVVLGVTTVPTLPSTPSGQRKNVQPVIIALAITGLGLGILTLALVWQKRNGILDK